MIKKNFLFYLLSRGEKNYHKTTIFFHSTPKHKLQNYSNLKTTKKMHISFLANLCETSEAGRFYHSGLKDGNYYR